MKVLEFTRYLLKIGRLVPMNPYSFYFGIGFFTWTFYPTLRYMSIHSDDLVLMAQSIYMVIILITTINDLVNFFIHQKNLENIFDLTDSIIEKCERFK